MTFLSHPICSLRPVGSGAVLTDGDRKIPILNCLPLSFPLDLFPYLLPLCLSPRSVNELTRLNSVVRQLRRSVLASLYQPLW